MSIDVMKQALEALEAEHSAIYGNFRTARAITALRAAIQHELSAFAKTEKLSNESRNLTEVEKSQVFTCSTGLCHFRKPLRDEEIDRVTGAQWASNNHKPIYAAHRAYARAIEAAHGIGEKP